MSYPSNNTQFTSNFVTPQDSIELSSRFQHAKPHVLSTPDISPSANNESTVSGPLDLSVNSPCQNRIWRNCYGGNRMEEDVVTRSIEEPVQHETSARHNLGTNVFVSQNLNSHVIANEEAKQIRESDLRLKCHFTGCGSWSTSLSSYEYHLKLVHYPLAFLKNFHFETFYEFRVWLSKEEHRLGCRFFRRGEDKSHYFCYKIVHHHHHNEQRLCPLQLTVTLSSKGPNAFDVRYLGFHNYRDNLLLQGWKQSKPEVSPKEAETIESLS